MLLFDTYASDVNAAARLALREDPRNFDRMPLRASAGFQMPLTARTHIGVEYGYSQDRDASPVNFRTGALPVDELAGHSATLRFGLTL